MTHCPLEQQPVQLPPPQVQAPLLHAWPAEQAPHALPPEPQALADCAVAATQLFCASQQPLGHEVGEQVQMPEAPQAWPVAHPRQAAPPPPQVLADWPA